MKSHGILNPLFGRRISPGIGIDTKCKGGACAGQAVYPVGVGIHYYGEFDVPALPAKLDGITYFIYFNIFFGDSKPNGRMNQFVPQLMLGNPLCESTGPPLYKPIWKMHDTWVFGSQYFFEIFNVTSNKTEAHAATGKVVSVVKGEILWTQFELDSNWVWKLSMGVKGDPSRVSTVIVPKPYMGLLPNEANSWNEKTFDHCHVSSCWELYGMRDRDHYPGSGSNYDMRITVDTPGQFKWYTSWSEREVPDCPGHPESNITENHNDTQQDVYWKLYWK